MFTDFFYLLRAYGLKASPTEWLALHDALDKGLHESSLLGFYRLCRAIVVHDEKDFDRFDQAYLEFFRNVEAEKERQTQSQVKPAGEDEDKDKKDDNKNNPPPPGSGGKANSLSLTSNEVEEKNQTSREEQSQQKGKQQNPNGANETYGNRSSMKGGVRIGGESRFRSAYSVASRRKFRDWRNDNTLDSRQFQLAFRSLRQLTDRSQAEKTELDLDRTVRRTCDNAGILHVEMKAPRKNNIKLLILIDSGGSMEPYSELCSLLFQSAQKAGSFSKLKIYYFHNFIGRYLYTSPEITLETQLDTSRILRETPSDYRVIIIADGQMSQYELYKKTLWIDEDNIGHQKCGFDWFMDFKKKYEHSIWLHPQKEPIPGTFMSQTYYLLRKEFSMFRLTLDGLNAGIKELLVKH